MWFKKYPPKQTPYDQAMERLNAARADVARLKIENALLRDEQVRLGNQCDQAQLRCFTLLQLLNEFCAFMEKFPHSRTRQAWHAVRNALVERYAALSELPAETDFDAPHT